MGSGVQQSADCHDGGVLWGVVSCGGVWGVECSGVRTAVGVGCSGLWVSGCRVGHELTGCGL